MALTVSVVDVTTEFQILVHLGAYIGTGGEALVVGVHNQTVGVGVTE